jgi:hypothetical protein
MDSKGALYGTTNKGGAGTCTGGCGTVFSLTRPASPGNHRYGVALSRVGREEDAIPVFRVVPTEGASSFWNNHENQ